MDLQNKTVVITGVSGGIGYHLCKQFIEKGCTVYGLGRTKPDITENGFTFITTDIRSLEEVKSAIRQITNESDAIDVVVNNAGVGYFGNIEEYSEEQIKAMFETNVYGLVYLNQLVVPKMKEQGSGHIFNISSIAGLDAFPQVSIYCATKHAVKAISESMYKEVRDYGVKVTCVYPGSVKTDFFRNIDSIEPNDNMLMPQDIATMIVQAAETPDNFHQVNLEIRPLQPKGKKNEQ